MEVAFMHNLELASDLACELPAAEISASDLRSLNEQARSLKNHIEQVLNDAQAALSASVDEPTTEALIGDEDVAGEADVSLDPAIDSALYDAHPTPTPILSRSASIRVKGQRFVVDDLA
jgi:hypothetical protein